MLYRLIAPNWLLDERRDLPKTYEGHFSKERLLELNTLGYNVYVFPNYPSQYEDGTHVDGSQIDVFNFVFVDCDLKHGSYSTKEQFIEICGKFPQEPTLIVDSGNGIHAYWLIDDLDAMSYLRLQRRLCRHFNTDEAVSKICQLMRVPGTMNTKEKGNFKPCEVLFESENSYTCEALDKALPPIQHNDEDYCKQHFDKTYKLNQFSYEVNDKIPQKFYALIEKSKEVKEIWSGGVDDRSKADYRLGHIMFANGFTKEEGRAVLVNAAKALSRAPQHRIGYAQAIIDKIWTFELDKAELNLSQTVSQILAKNCDNLKGTRFYCNKLIDDTNHGFRLGQVIGLVAGSGVGKTAMALNMFRWFVELNPDYIHFFIPLEQPTNEIADRWKTMCGDDTRLHDKVHVMSNYEENGAFRHLSFSEIKDYLLKFQKETGKKIGCVVVDHIGALNKKGKLGENQDIMDICHNMKSFAVELNVLLIMQSQTSREKAGIGDLELNKDAAYGSVFFESYADYLISMWQPLKRCYKHPECPTVTAFKFCKIRHKKMGVDKILEDVLYTLYFDPRTEQMRELTQDEEKAFDYWNKQATNKRKQDRKTDVLTYVSIRTEDKWRK
jgi:ABC-type dipeptide/oligopeptide/nickel transport system ATPase component